MHSSARSALVLTTLLASAAAPAHAQALDSLATRLGGMSAITGLEDAMADTLFGLLPGSQRDRAGNVVLTRGNGNPVRIAACPMDEVGYVVGEFNAEGYLTLRRVGTTPVGALYDQFLEGHRVTVFGRRGPVPGVVGVRSTHLTRGRPADGDPAFRLDNAYVDVGATSADEARQLGIVMLSPVTRAKAVHRYGARGGLLAAPWMGQRAACAALLSAALRTTSATGTTIVAFTARRHFAHDGTSFVIDGHPGADVVLLGDTASAIGEGPIVSTTRVAGRAHPTWLLPIRYARTPTETVALADVAALEQRLAAWLGGAR